MLRKIMRDKRKSMDNSEKKIADESIKNKFLASNEYKNAESIFVYVSTNEEIDTLQIIKSALDNGKKVSVPKVIRSGIMKAIRIKSLEDLSDKNFYGILEPDINGEDCSEEIDLSIVPGLAFTSKGERLGYGGGYYDRFFCAYKKSIKISFCYKYQVVTNVYNSEYDVSIDRIITQ